MMKKILNALVRPEVKEWSFRKEMLAGLVNFLAAGYIVAVNPEILSNAGMDRSALIAATCYATAIGCFIMGMWAKVPIMLAPGMGLNAFFAYTLCVQEGIAWQVALGIVFISGVIFIALSVLGVRQHILYAIPKTLRIAISVGIGLFISFLGFENMKLITAHPATLVTLGPIEPTLILALVGLAAAIALEYYKVPGSLLIVILGVTSAALAFGWIEGPSQWLAAPPSIAPVAFKLDIVSALKPVFLVPVFVFLYLDLFDSIGSLTAVSYQAGLNKGDDIPALNKMLLSDASATAVGAVLGTSTVTAYIESSIGIASGGRTGWTALITGVLFLFTPFFSGVVAVIPPYATGIALVVVGLYFMKNISEIDFGNMEEGAPAFLTILLMPLTFSIATGICFGILTYISMVIITRKWENISLVLVFMGAISLLYLVFNTRGLGH